MELSPFVRTSELKLKHFANEVMKFSMDKANIGKLLVFSYGKGRK